MDWIPNSWKALWSDTRKDFGEFFWDEGRAMVFVLAFLTILGGVFYATGGFERTVPYLWWGAAKFQDFFQGPGDPETTYARVLELRPTWGELYFERGALKERKGFAQDALEDYEKAGELMTGVSRPWIAHGRVSVVMGLFDQARTDFQRAMDRDPKDAGPYIERARMHLKMESYEMALADFKRAVELEPQSVDARIGVETAEQRIAEARYKTRTSN